MIRADILRENIKLKDNSMLNKTLKSIEDQVLERASLGHTFVLVQQPSPKVFNRVIQELNKERYFIGYGYDVGDYKALRISWAETMGG